ncbi:hypothetical protein [Chryseobacterium sp.]|uniref:hypothetical protein n=1 Tax=Chryseobacterium sp. TaxID=1871047 RepID=UPI0025B94474|nr:hypothetical protein [Chryseobacterium sp.]
MAEIENGAQPIENTPTQTLFRFVSLRSPELTDDTEQNNRFVVIPSGLTSDDKFYKPAAEATSSKQEVLRTKAAEYAVLAECISKENSNNTLAGFKRAYNVIYNFATWLARNKSTCSYEELVEKKNAALTGYKPEILMVWNNFIYQVVTQKDFYIKETLMQVIFALHVLESPTSNEEEAKIVLGARIVLPKEMMIDDDINSSSSSVVSKVAAKASLKDSFPTEGMKKQQAVSAAKMRLGHIEALKKDMVAIEKQYNKDYQTHYKSQEEAYQKEIAPILAKYNEELEAAKNEYCSVREPGVEYNPEDPCQQPKYVPYPELPKFDFYFSPEVSSESLITSLKTDNLVTLLDVLGFKFYNEFVPERPSQSDVIQMESLMGGKDTFKEINSLIEESVEKNNTIIVENTESNSQVYTSIGGVIVPVAKTTVVPFTYQICPKFVKAFSLDLALNIPDTTWDIAAVSYILTSNSGTQISNSYYVKSKSGNTIYLNDLLNDGVDFYTIENSSLEIKIAFTNGNEAAVSISGITARTCVSSSFELIAQDGSNPTIPDGENNFIPSGFGFKQVGIADYLKVEQSTHAYVEGEVSNIENIMAREYREKSTRRLRKSENTTTTSTDTEREQLTDTTTANRYEMQSEIAKIMQEASDNNTQFSANAHYGGNKWGVSTGLGSGYANHKSKEESTRQAMTQSQDITSRAMDRIVTKVHEERIEKIIEEFEENNSHGFDNRKGDQHVVGVYRWVDKLMKNQIYNYGKRMMFEFMIPEPSKLYSLGLDLTKDLLTKPEDPRKALTLTMADSDALQDESILRYWVGKYNVEIENIPSETVKLSKAFAYGKDKVGDIGSTGHTTSAIGLQETITIPEGYISKSYSIKGGGKQYLENGSSLLNVNIGDIHAIINSSAGTFQNQNNNFSGYTGELGVGISTDRFYSFEAVVSIDCALSMDAKKQWMQKTFNAIISAYEEALLEYENKLAEEQNKAVEIKGSNPNYYRQIENTILRKNCISYISDRSNGSTHGYGLAGLTQGTTFTDYETTLNEKLDKYTAFVKFMEQAFEWENLSYYLYPFYWGNKFNWVDLYLAEDTDPTFKAFLQSGMARVIVTVRPGFEDAVQFYLATGKIWNGGEVPVIGDVLYLSIVDELKQPQGEKQGKPWITRLPTSLNILQAESIGLKVAHALPFTEEDPEEFEVPSDVITKDRFNFEKNENLLGVQDSTSGESIISGDWL